MFEQDININCRHLWDVFLFVRNYLCYIFYEIADNDLIDCILDKTMFPQP